ncbi:MAG TPA: transketolase, partial [bacterium]|nr:transketolase [bacterium]
LIEIITVLYYHYLNINSIDPLNNLRDRFILSKGHSCYPLYYILADKGFFDKSELEKITKDSDLLGAHPEINNELGIEITSGSLGHGLSIACGIALAGKFNKKTYKTFVLLGDGECQEGSVWEAALFAAQHKLSELIAIVDYNKLQAIQPVSEVLELNPLSEKWRAFGWNVLETNGHSINDIINCIDKFYNNNNDKPNVLIANTIKGRGVSYMENTAIWHYRAPNDEEYKIALNELKR